VFKVERLGVSVVDSVCALDTVRFDLDKKAETLTDEWKSNMGCSSRSEFPSTLPTVCCVYACAMHVTRRFVQMSSCVCHGVFSPFFPWLAQQWRTKGALADFSAFLHTLGAVC